MQVEFARMVLDPYLETVVSMPKTYLRELRLVDTYACKLIS